MISWIDKIFQHDRFYFIVFTTVILCDSLWDELEEKLDVVFDIVITIVMLYLIILCHRRLISSVDEMYQCGNT